MVMVMRKVSVEIVVVVGEVGVSVAVPSQAVSNLVFITMIMVVTLRHILMEFVVHRLQNGLVFIQQVVSVREVVRLLSMEDSVALVLEVVPEAQMVFLVGAMILVQDMVPFGVAMFLVLRDRRIRAGNLWVVVHVRRRVMDFRLVGLVVGMHVVHDRLVVQSLIIDVVVVVVVDAMVILVHLLSMVQFGVVVVVKTVRDGVMVFFVVVLEAQVLALVVVGAVSVQLGAVVQVVVVGVHVLDYSLVMVHAVVRVFVEVDRLFLAV